MESLRLAGSNFMCVKAGLTGISGAATTFSTGTLTLQYSVNGKAATKAQVAGGTTPTTDAVTGNAMTLVKNKGTVLVWGFDASGTIKVMQGATVDLDSGGNFVIYPQFPAVPDTITPFAYTLHQAGSTLVGTFTVGTSNWNTTGLTHTVVDVLALPDRPQKS